MLKRIKKWNNRYIYGIKPTIGGLNFQIFIQVKEDFLHLILIFLFVPNCVYKCKEKKREFYVQRKEKRMVGIRETSTLSDVLMKMAVAEILRRRICR